MSLQNYVDMPPALGKIRLGSMTVAAGFPLEKLLTQFPMAKSQVGQ